MKINKKVGEMASELGIRVSGAKETRTPDPLLAKSAQGVQHCPWPGMTRFASPSESEEIRPCWCQPWVSTGEADARFGQLVRSKIPAVQQPLCASAGRHPASIPLTSAVSRWFKRLRAAAPCPNWPAGQSRRSGRLAEATRHRRRPDDAAR
jgi:hypothetical protein